MPKQGGQGKGKPKMSDKHFGKALIRKQARGAQGLAGIKTQQGPNMVSLLEHSALDDFIITTQMEREAPEVFRVHQNHAFLVSADTARAPQNLSLDEFKMQQLVIPRKPRWTRSMTADEVDRNERDEFLAWRRDIAALEQSSNFTRKATPFEKNIEVWRQLWRVVERSDLVVQIVDSRNPLLFYTEDLMKYAAEQRPQPKPMILILNKADFLTDYQRSAWARYLQAAGIRFVFYSARIEQDKIDAAAASSNPTLFESEEAVYEDEVDEDEDDSEEEEVEVEEVERKELTDKTGEKVASSGVNDDVEEEAKAKVEGESAGGKEGREGRAAEGGALLSESNELSDRYLHILAADVAAAWAQTALEQTVGMSQRQRQGQRQGQLARGNGDGPDDADSELEEEQEEEEEEGSDGEGPESVEPRQAGVAAAAAEQEVVGDEAELLNSLRTRILTRKELTRLLAVLPEHFGVERSTHWAATNNNNNSSNNSEYRKNRSVAGSAQASLAGSTMQQRVCIGMLGYPNVGKSSVINSILGVSKSTHGTVRVAVSSTPGKTKHFQTLIVSDDLLLCDCPGLVFPSFMNSTGEMLCSGILPINQMRDCIEPADIIASRIPTQLLEATYGMQIKREREARLKEALWRERQLQQQNQEVVVGVTGEGINSEPGPGGGRLVLNALPQAPSGREVLAAYSALKGYITSGTGRWDEFRSCKELLRDFNDGRILYAVPPPALPSSNGIEREDPGMWLLETEKVMMMRDKVAERVLARRLKEEDVLKEARKETQQQQQQQLHGAPMPSAALVSMADNDNEGDMLDSDEDGEMVFGDFRSHLNAAGADGDIGTVDAALAASDLALDVGDTTTSQAAASSSSSSRGVAASAAPPKIIDGYEIVEDSDEDEDDDDAEAADLFPSAAAAGGKGLSAAYLDPSGMRARAMLTAGGGQRGSEDAVDDSASAVSGISGMSGMSLRSTGSASGIATVGGGGPREHKRLKHWGKKNKKLRNKNPYGDEEDEEGHGIFAKSGASKYVAYSTNRTQAYAAGAGSGPGSGSGSQQSGSVHSGMGRSALTPQITGHSRVLAASQKAAMRAAAEGGGGSCGVQQQGDEVSVSTAGTTGTVGTSVSGTHRKHGGSGKLRRHNPREQYGVPYVRSILPHHAQQNVPADA